MLDCSNLDSVSVEMIMEDTVPLHIDAVLDVMPTPNKYVVDMELIQFIHYLEKLMIYRINIHALTLELSINLYHFN